MSNFTRFNHKPGVNINMGYQDREQYLPLSATPFKKAADLYAINPEMVYSIRAMYHVSGDYGDQIIAIVKPEYPTNVENTTVNAINLNLDGVFRMTLPHKYVEVINVDDPALISDCNQGLARFRITEYYSKRFKKELYDVEFL